VGQIHAQQVQCCCWLVTVHTLLAVPHELSTTAMFIIYQPIYSAVCHRRL
jgi:hypothetical protein